MHNVASTISWRMRKLMDNVGGKATDNGQRGAQRDENLLSVTDCKVSDL